MGNIVAVSLKQLTNACETDPEQKTRHLKESLRSGGGCEEGEKQLNDYCREFVSLAAFSAYCHPKLTLASVGNHSSSRRFSAAIAKYM
jgi:hypothetical protein